MREGVVRSHILSFYYLSRGEDRRDVVLVLVYVLGVRPRRSDFNARLPGPVTGRPRRPLSNNASTASCSMRFSLLMMISGAPRSRSRFSRLLRLITRR